MPKKSTESFEDNLAGLEQTIEKLESEGLTLDKALLYFEKGIGHIRACDARLKKADGALKELLKGENGKFVEKVLGVDLSSALGGEQLDD
jgi:exodeoxyribonuclease VII small subunit